MKTLAKALVQMALVLNACADDTTDPVRELSIIAHTLRSASPDEMAAIREALEHIVDTSPTDSTRAAAQRFSMGFLVSMGVRP